MVSLEVTPPVVTFIEVPELTGARAVVTVGLYPLEWPVALGWNDS